MGKFFAIVIIVIILVLLGMSLRVVPQGYNYVIERLGRYTSTWAAGLHVLVPFIDRVGKKVNVKEQVADFAPQSVITKDNVTIEVDSIVYFKVFDPRLYAYGVENPIMALDNLTATTLRNIIGEMELDEVLTSREKINAGLLSVVDRATDPWGIRVTRIEIRSVIVNSPEIKRAMEQQSTAEREKRRMILEAEGHKQSIITRKQGDKEAMILDAEAKKAAKIAAAEADAKAVELAYNAQARGLQVLIDKVGIDGALKLKQLEALQAVADGNATKLVVPTDLTKVTSDVTTAAVLAKAGLAKDAVKPADAAPAKEEDPCCDPNEQHDVDDPDNKANGSDSIDEEVSDLFKD